MKTLQDIEKEYENFSVQNGLVTNLEDFLAYIEIGIDDVTEYEKDYTKELKENKLWKLEAMVRNFFFFIFAQEEASLYDEDSKVLEECIGTTQKYQDYFKRLRDLATDKNVKEIYRLVEFSCKYYCEQMDYYDYLRDCIESTAKGFSIYNSQYENNREVFAEFMEKKIKEIVDSSDKENRNPQYIRKLEN